MIGLFINVSLLFLFIRCFFIETWSNYGEYQWANMVGFIFYTGFLIYIQVMYSLDIINGRCNSDTDKNYNIDDSKIIGYVLFPNIIIFMSMFLILKVFPGWKSPFSNTFGYFLASTMGINSNFNHLLTPVDEGDNDGAVKLNAAIKLVAGNKSLMINQFTVDNFSNTFKSFVDNKIFDVGEFKKEQTFKKNAENSSKKEAIKGLYHAVVAKDLVSEHIWYILTGCLVITIIKNTMGELNCGLIKIPN